MAYVSGWCFFPIKKVDMRGSASTDKAPHVGVCFPGEHPTLILVRIQLVLGEGFMVHI